MINKEKLYGLLVLSIFFIFSTFSTGCSVKKLPFVKEKLKELDKITTEETRRAVGENPELQELDNVCKRIPFPETFSLVAEHLAVGKPPAISYYYYSEDKFAISDEYLVKHFTDNNWETISNLPNSREFKNQHHRIVIHYGIDREDANYGVFCEKAASPK